MAKRHTYIQNHDGNREWVNEPFTDDAYKSDEYIYLCQHSDGHKTELDIVKIPRSQWEHLVEKVNETLRGFK